MELTPVIDALMEDIELVLELELDEDDVAVEFKSVKTKEFEEVSELAELVAVVFTEAGADVAVRVDETVVIGMRTMLEVEELDAGELRA